MHLTKHEKEKEKEKGNENEKIMRMRMRKRADFSREPVDAHVFMNGWMADRPDGMKRSTKCEAKGSGECQHRTSLQISEGPKTLFGGSFDADHQTEEGDSSVSGAGSISTRRWRIKR